MGIGAREVASCSEHEKTSLVYLLQFWGTGLRSGELGPH